MLENRLNGGSDPHHSPNKESSSQEPDRRSEISLEHSSLPRSNAPLSTAEVHLTMVKPYDQYRVSNTGSVGRVGFLSPEEHWRLSNNEAVNLEHFASIEQEEEITISGPNCRGPYVLTMVGESPAFTWKRLRPYPPPHRIVTPVGLEPYGALKVKVEGGEAEVGFIRKADYPGFQEGRGIEIFSSTIVQPGDVGSVKAPNLYSLGLSTGPWLLIGLGKISSMDCSVSIKTVESKRQNQTVAIQLGEGESVRLAVSSPVKFRLMDEKNYSLKKQGLEFESEERIVKGFYPFPIGLLGPLQIMDVFEPRKPGLYYLVAQPIGLSGLSKDMRVRNFTVDTPRLNRFEALGPVTLKARQKVTVGTEDFGGKISFMRPEEFEKFLRGELAERERPFRTKPDQSKRVKVPGAGDWFIVAEGLGARITAGPTTAELSMERAYREAAQRQAARRTQQSSPRLITLYKGSEYIPIGRESMSIHVTTQHKWD